MRSVESQGHDEDALFSALLVSAVIGIAVMVARRRLLRREQSGVTDGAMHSGGQRKLRRFSGSRGSRRVSLSTTPVRPVVSVIGDLFQGYVPFGDNAFWMTTAPPGITITSAWTRNGDVGRLRPAGFAVGDFWKDNSTRHIRRLRIWPRAGGGSTPASRELRTSTAASMAYRSYAPLAVSAGPISYR